MQKEFAKKFGFRVMVIGLVCMVFLGVYATVYVFPSTVYDIYKAQQWLMKARASTDLDVIANYITNALAEIQNRQGNPSWWFPTAKTDFGIIKAVLQENINSSREVAQTEAKGSYGYQRAIGNIEEIIIETNNHLGSAIKWLTTASLTTIFWLVTLPTITVIACYIWGWGHW